MSFATTEERSGAVVEGKVERNRSIKGRLDRILRGQKGDAG